MTATPRPFNSLYTNAQGELHATYNRKDAFPCPECGVPVKWAIYDGNSTKTLKKPVRFLQDIANLVNHRKGGQYQCRATALEHYRQQLAELSTATAGEVTTKNKGENK